MINRTKRSVLAAVVILASMGAAHADGLYVGGNLGAPDYNSSINGVTGRGSGAGGKIFGGYALTPNLAVEAGAYTLGHIDNSTGTLNTRGVFLDAVGTYEVAPQWSVLGRAGLAQGRFTTTTGDDTSPAFKLGLGGEYDLTPAIALRGEYERYHYSNAFESKANVGELSVGVKMGF